MPSLSQESDEIKKKQQLHDPFDEQRIENTHLIIKIPSAGSQLKEKLIFDETAKDTGPYPPSSMFHPSGALAAFISQCHAHCISVPAAQPAGAHSSQPSKDVVQTRCCLRYVGAADSVVVASGCWSTGDQPGVSHFCFPSLCCSFRLKASRPSRPPSPVSTDAPAYRPTCR